MKVNLYKLLTILCFSMHLIHGIAIAEDSQQVLVPLPSIPDYTRGSGWGLALGFDIEYESAYDAGGEYAFEIEPRGGLHYRLGDHLFFLEGKELGWRGLVSDKWLLQTGVRHEDGLDPKVSDEGALDGIEERDSHFVGFFEARRSVGSDWRNWVAGRIVVGPSDFGWGGFFAAGHRFGDRTDGGGTEVFGFTMFGNDSFINKDFGVTAEDSANSGLAQTELSGGFRSIGINIFDKRYLTRNIQFVSHAGAELYSNDIQESPIAREDYELELGFSVIWQF